MLRRSSSVRSFDVACREKAVSTWSAGMPEPLSWTLMDLVPPCSMATEICVAPASRAFSTQLLDDGGRPLDDLAGRDLSGDVGWQDLYGHGFSMWAVVREKGKLSELASLGRGNSARGG